MIPAQRSADVPSDPAALAQLVRAILATRNLTLYKIAALSRARYPRQTAYHIRLNFYFQLRSGLSPTLYQVSALSELTGYRLKDWLEVFGFSLAAIPRFEAVLARPRTGLIDSKIADTEVFLPALVYRQQERPSRSVAPLSQLLKLSETQLTAGVEPTRHDFLYAKVGFEDAFAFPEIAPGSIVRADPELARSLLPATPGERSRHLFLVEHSRGLSCARLRVSGPNRVAFAPSELPFADTQFVLGTEARVLGVLDLELRFFPLSSKLLPNGGAPRVARDLAEAWTPTAIEKGPERPAALLKRARLQAGLSLRCASKLSREVAKALGDYRYFASPGTLSDYEAGDKPPRHIHKLFTIAILYSVGFEDLLRSFGIPLDDARRAAIPEEVGKVSGGRRFDGRNVLPGEAQAGGFLGELQKQFGDLPLFLAGALPALSGLPRITLRDVFWVGGQVHPLHPSLSGALFVLVNRRSKKPRFPPRTPFWKRPPYVLQNRDGSYLCAGCAIEGRRLMVDAYPRGFTRLQPVRRHADAEVVGEIVGIARSLVSPP